MTAPTTLLAGYVLEERIAVGGMAEIFRARREGPAGFAKRVAVKRVLPDLSRDPAFVAMFLEEARLQARLSSANLVQVFDFGEERGAYYLVMEYVDGLDLAALLTRAGPLALPVVAHLGHELCRALVDLHAALGDDGAPLHIVHRDVTPANVLLSTSGDVKLGDFGVAKARARSLRTARGAIKGKLAYLSPEQARGEELDARADLYGLGLVLFEAATGVRYLEADDEVSLLKLAEHPRWRSPAGLRPDLPPACEDLLAKLLAPEPERRLATARLAATLWLKAFPVIDAALGREALAVPVRSAYAELGHGEKDVATSPSSVVPSILARSDHPLTGAPPLPDRPTPLKSDRPRTEVLARSPARYPRVSIRRVFGGVGVGVAALVGVLALWPDTDRPERSDNADRAVGSAEPSPALTGSAAPATPATGREHAAGKQDPASPTVPPTTTRVALGPRDARPAAQPDQPRVSPTATTTTLPLESDRSWPAVSLREGPAVPAGARSTASDLEQARAALLAIDHGLQTRELMPADLPGLAALREKIAAALARGEAPLVELERLADAIARVKVDRAFIDAKLMRLDKAMTGRPLDPATRKKLGQQAQVALSLSLQGRYDAANAELNAIAHVVEP